ncbi:hypothetical protein [Helicobacter pylori]|nr:hypothetical protein [Helicobacter pylori]
MGVLAKDRVVFKQRSLTPLTLQEESGLKLALYGCDGGARSKRESVLMLL